MIKQKTIFWFLLCFNMAFFRLSSQSDTLIYIGDPMCSWCYGFSPELDKIKAAFPNTVFEMVMGGLRAGGQETVADLEDFLHHHWIEVEKASGQRFNHAILSRGNLIYNTEPACRAVTVVRQLNPQKTYEYFKSLQKAFYVENLIPTDLDVLTQLAFEVGINPEDFKNTYRNPQAKADVYSEFDLANALGAKGFPTLIAKINQRMFLVTSGYQKSDKIILSLKNRGLR